MEINGKLIDNSSGDFYELISDKKSSLYTITNHSKVNLSNKKMVELLKKCGACHQSLFEYVKTVENGLIMCFVVKPFKNFTCTMLNYLNGHKVEDKIEVFLRLVILTREFSTAVFNFVLIIADYPFSTCLCKDM